MARAIEAQEFWNFEGGLSATYANRLARADVIIWLDLPVGLRLWRVLRRTARHWDQQRPDLPEGCPERRNPGFWSFLRFILRTRQTGRNRLIEVFRKIGKDQTLHVLRSPQGVARLQSQIARPTV